MARVAGWVAVVLVVACVGDGASVEDTVLEGTTVGGVDVGGVVVGGTGAYASTTKACSRLPASV